MAANSAVLTCEVLPWSIDISHMLFYETSVFSLYKYMILLIYWYLNENDLLLTESK